MRVIADAAAGNPFFAEELAASADAGDVRVPEHVSVILNLRLERLPGQARRLVLLTAALPDDFAVADLAAVAGVDAARAEAAVGAALRRGLLKRDGSRLRFVHATLVRAAEGPAEALALVDRAEAVLDEVPQCRFCSVDYYLAGATAYAHAGDSARAHAFLARVEQTAELWNGGPWASAAAEARGAVLAADGDKEAATQALRTAITGYATAGQHINEARARHSLAEHLAMAH